MIIKNPKDLKKYGIEECSLKNFKINIQKLINGCKSKYDMGCLLECLSYSFNQRFPREDQFYLNNNQLWEKIAKNFTILGRRLLI